MLTRRRDAPIAPVNGLGLRVVGLLPELPRCMGRERGAKRGESDRGELDPRGELGRRARVALGEGAADTERWVNAMRINLLGGNVSDDLFDWC